MLARFLMESQARVLKMDFLQWFDLCKDIMNSKSPHAREICQMDLDKSLKEGENMVNCKCANAHEFWNSDRRKCSKDGFFQKI